MKKYEIGDKIFIQAEVIGYNPEGGRLLPYRALIEADGEDRDGCSTFVNFSDRCKTVGSCNLIEICDCFSETSNKTLCLGTKEMKTCCCGGDKTKCDFYQSVRDSAKKELHMVTVEEYRTALREFYKLNYCDILKMFDIREYTVSDKESAIVEIILGYDPAEVVGAYEDYQNEYIINVGDVIILKPENKEFLVTKIDKGSYSLIAKDGQATNITYQNLTNTMPKNRFEKIKTGITIREFFYD